MKPRQLSISIVLANDINYGIAKDDIIPWKSKTDIKHFKELTLNSTVIMGRKTWDSLPRKHKPLPYRRNIIITHDVMKLKSNILEEELDYDILNTEIDVYDDLDKAIEFETNTSLKSTREKIFIIGGANIYNQCLNHPLLKHIYLTTIYDDYVCDTFVDKDILIKIIENKKEDIDVSKKIICENDKESIILYTITHINESNYINLARKVLFSGNVRKTRNSEVYSLFGERLEFDLEDGFPLLTTKKMFWKGIVEELMWFLKGDTNVKHLQEKGVHIWDGNTSREYLDKNGFPHLKEGDAGAIYSHQWRHFDAPYIDCDTDYSGKGFDQVQDCLNLIKNDPTSRRIIISGWNPNQFKDTSLVACHVLYQFYVDVDEKELSCMMTQRSADLFLGLPFNIASTALLTTLMAHQSGLKPKRIIINLGDVHVYDIHKDAINKQITNESSAFGFPKLEITCLKEKIEDYVFEDFKLERYFNCGMIKASMLP